MGVCVCTHVVHGEQVVGAWVCVRVRVHSSTSR
jgi:hypothetical protein